jgi:hypothetical protein
LATISSTNRSAPGGCCRGEAAEPMIGAWDTAREVHARARGGCCRRRAETLSAVIARGETHAQQDERRREIQRRQKRDDAQILPLDPPVKTQLMLPAPTIKRPLRFVELTFTARRGAFNPTHVGGDFPCANCGREEICRCVGVDSTSLRITARTLQLRCRSESVAS